MKRGRKDGGALRLHQAFDELRFGREHTLNLRASLPTAADARARAEAWLRERQVARAGEVLVITGRGASSFDGVSVVRESVLQLLYSLRRRGVVSAVEEHTPGSFVVRLAPLKALRDAAPRLREPERLPQRRTPKALEGLEPRTRELLAVLAELSLSELGVRDVEQFLEGEMLAHLSRLTPAVRHGGDREVQLQNALERAIEEYGS